MVKYGLDTDKTYTNKKGFKFNLIEINSSINIIIRFESGYQVKTTAHKIINGSPKDKLSPSVHGVGINDIGGAKDEYYDRWFNMIKRCYSKSSLKASSTYIGCSVCEDWLLFSNFKEWMVKQDWHGKELDKDIISPRNKVYSPSTCVFVDRKINTLLCDCASKRGKYPQGVSKNKKRFKAQMKYIDSELLHIGTYDTPEEAYSNYCKVKSEYIKTIADTQEPKVRNGLYKHAAIFEKDSI